MGNPFRQFIVKVCSRCNLNCSYCYVYNLADTTWKSQPRFMQPEVVLAMCRCIRQHMEKHGLSRVQVVVHGGEPLLYGKERMEWFLRTVLSELGGAVDFAIQTNGTRLDRGWVDLLVRYGVEIGISLDGPQEYHDRHRVDHRGRGSFAEAVAGIRCVLAHPEGKRRFRGVLSVADPSIPPEDYFGLMRDLGVPSFSFLLPQHNHDRPPPAEHDHLAQWIIRLLELWLEDGKGFSVSFLESMLLALLGSPAGNNEFFNAHPLDFLVIETDGGIEPSDSLKSCNDGLTKLGLNVLADELDAVYAHPFMQLAQNAKIHLCETCQRCEYAASCAGGRMSDRYSRRTGFDNPSVYCDTLKQVFRHARTILELIPPDIRQRLADPEPGS